MSDNLLGLFPRSKRRFWARVAEEEKKLQEIRLRINRPIIVLKQGKEYFLDYEGNITGNVLSASCVTQEDLEELLHHICNYSLYAFEDEMKQGFITVKGGHRVGIAGQVVLDGTNSVRTIKHISYMNIRIAHELPGVANKVLPMIYQAGSVKNLLIISPPGCGKTTLLRDLVRQISNGNAFGEGVCVGVVDERSEIAGTYLGIPQNDIGIRTDVLDACPKTLGMMLLLRSMAPGVIAIDELGGREDMEALYLAASCGSKIIATIHGDGLMDVVKKYGAAQLLRKQVFDSFFVLGKRGGKCEIIRHYEREEAYAEISRSSLNSSRMLRIRPVEKGTALDKSGDFKGNGTAVDTAYQRNSLWKSNAAGMLREN